MKKFIFIFLILLFPFLSKSQTLKVYDQVTQEEVLNYELKKHTVAGSSDTSYSIHHQNYKTYAFKISTTDLQKALTIFLQPSYINMNEIVISANRTNEKLTDLPRQVQVINAKTIAFQNRQNTGDLLEQNGNVFLQKSQQGGGSPVIRGFESNRVLLVIDGVRMNNAIYRGGHLQNVLRIDQNMLERSEILFGAGSVIYGSDALGGVMYFESKTPTLNKFTNQAYLRYGTVNNENTFHYDVNLGFKKWAHLISFTHSNFGDLRQGTNKQNTDGDTIYQRNYYNVRFNNRDSMVKNNDPALQLGTKYSQYDLMYKTLYNQNKNTQHIFNFQLSNTSNVPRYDRLNEWKEKNYRSAEWYYGPELRTLVSYQLIYNSANYFFDKYKLTTGYQYIEESRNDRAWQSTTLNQRNEFVHVGTLNIDFFKTIKNNANSVHEIRYGIDWQGNLVRSNANKLDIITNETTPQSTRYPDGGSNMNLFAAFISHSWEIGKKIIISDGLRYSYTNVNATFNNKTFFPFLQNSFAQNNQALNGNIGVVYLPIKNIKLYVNLSNAFRAPNIDDLGKTFESASGKSVIIPNPNLKPEFTNNLEIGTSAILFKKIKFEGSLFYTQMYDAIALNNAKLNGADSVLFENELTKVVSNQNVREAYLYGYNFQLSADIFKSLYVSTTLSYTYGRIKTDSSDYPLDHIPPMYGKTSIGYFIKKFNMEFSSNYNAMKPIADYNLTESGEDNPQFAPPSGAPAWYTLNAKVQYVFGKKGKVIIQSGVDNISDLQYRVFSSGMSAAGRNFWVCVRIKI